MGRKLLVLVGLTVMGCTPSEGSDDPGETVDPPLACGPGDLALHGCGQRCPAGEVMLEDGSCLPAGVPAERCGEGFVAQDGACAPVLAEDCPFGQIAVPGDETCRPLGDCGSGTWGNIPSDGAIVYVDGAAAPGGTGTTAAPYDSIAAAVAAAPAGATVAIAAGTYAEDLTITKNVSLHGRCAEMVEIAGVSEVGAVFFQEDGALVDLSVTGPQIGVLVSGAENVLIERVHVHDTGWRGVDFENVFGATGGRLVDSLVEQASENGVYALGANLQIERSVVRATVPAMGQARGVNVQTDIPNQIPSTVTMIQSVVERHTDVAVRVWGANLEMIESVVRDTTFDAGGEFGRAIDVYTDPASRANATITASVIDGAATTGIHIEGDAVLDAVTVRDVTHEPYTGGFGRCLVASDAPGAAPTMMTITSSVLERCVGGIMLDGAAQATIAGVLIREMVDSGAERARGIQVQGSTDGLRAGAQIFGSVILGAQQAGVVVDGGDALLDGVHIADTNGWGLIVQTELPPLGSATAVGTLIERSLGMGATAIGGALTFQSSVVSGVAPDESQILARGLSGQYSLISGQRGQLAVYDSLVEQTEEAGIIVMGGDAILQGSAVRDTDVLPAGNLGDGVAIASFVWAGELFHSTASIDGMSVSDSARAGLSAFSSDVTLANSRLSCQGFDINREKIAEFDVTLTNAGGNACGCPEPSDECKAVSAGLAPPEPAGDL